MVSYAAKVFADVPHPADTTKPTLTGQLDLYDTHDDPHSEGLTEPPPDPLQYAYEFIDDILGDLDFHDLPRERPTRSHVDADLIDLRRRRDDARRHADVLAQAIFEGRGPAEAGAADELADIHRRRTERGHHQHNLAHAHADWIAVDHKTTSRAEVEILEAAGVRSPAAMYAVPNEAIADLEDKALSPTEGGIAHAMAGAKPLIGPRELRVNWLIRVLATHMRGKYP